VEDPKPHQQQQGRQVLDGHRRADLQAVDREEEGGVDGRKPQHTEQGEAGQLGALHPQQVAPGDS
jgi:hypothetical protein